MPLFSREPGEGKLCLLRSSCIPTVPGGSQVTRIARQGLHMSGRLIDLSFEVSEVSTRHLAAAFVVMFVTCYPNESVLGGLSAAIGPRAGYL